MKTGSFAARSAAAARTVCRIIFCVAISIGASKKPLPPLGGDGCFLTDFIEGNSNKVVSCC